MFQPAEDAQAETVAFLSTGRAYGTDDAEIDRITTHISHLFLAGDRAYKLKRAVRLPYLDFSTLELRRAACEREVALNRRTAPELYLGVLAVTRESAGRLALAGTGTPVEWLVEMRRFDQEALLDRMSRAGALAPSLVRDLADAVAAFHASADRLTTGNGAAAIEAVIDGNDRSFAACPEAALDRAQVGRLQRSCRENLDRVSLLLDRRGAEGKIRRCHGDLHLRNICVIDHRPILFDCIEFSDELATIDVLYDLAFLLMDLLKRGLTPEANLVFNRYLDRADEVDGMAALPLFLALRAAIRAHVAALDDGPRATEAGDYLALALRSIDCEPPRLVAIGGLSGTGKSTLAYGLAPTIGSAPGARVIRSDVIRKRLFGAAPEQRLNADAYSPSVTERVYARMRAEASALLRAGRSVVLDAVHAQPAERDAASRIAEAAGVPFTGFWLTAPTSLLEARLARRVNDASDADAAILHRQTSYDLGEVNWTGIDAGADIESTIAAMRDSL